MADPSAFAYVLRANGDVTIRRGGREIARLRGTAAMRFAEDVRAGEPQEVMARFTGNYRRGNERTASHHPRNRGG